MGIADVGTQAPNSLWAETETRMASVETGSGEIIFPLGGEWLLDPNEINGWGPIGPYDPRNSQDLGNTDATTLTRVAGGLAFPFDVRLKWLYAWHYNSNASAQAWGWYLASQECQAGTNNRTTTEILDEVEDNAGVGPRDYQNNLNQLTSIDLSGLSNNVITAGDILVFGASAPTAVGTNYYVRIFSGYLYMERV